MTWPLGGFLVTRCVCMRTPFDQLLPVARSRGWDLDALVRETGCGNQCGLCRPYLAAMLRTGTTRFTEPVPDLQPLP